MRLREGGREEEAERSTCVEDAIKEVMKKKEKKGNKKKKQQK